MFLFTFRCHCDLKSTSPNTACKVSPVKFHKSNHHVQNCENIYTTTSKLVSDNWLTSQTLFIRQTIVYFMYTEDNQGFPQVKPPRNKNSHRPLTMEDNL